jgi:hypothetical protein
MPIKRELVAKEAKHGQKMVEVKVRFWTDDIAAEKGKVVPKHAWAAGVVRIERNDAHEITPSQPVPFNSLLDLGTAIEKVLIEHGVVLHSSAKMKKYFAGE